MGKRGDKLTGAATESVEDYIRRISPLGEVSRKKMFGGYGIFESGTMFALVNSSGEVHLKVGDTNRSRFDQAGAKPHGRMPYYQIPARVMEDDEALLAWTREAIELSKASKK